MKKRKKKTKVIINSNDIETVKKRLENERNKKLSKWNEELTELKGLNKNKSLNSIIRKAGNKKKKSIELNKKN